MQFAWKQILIFFIVLLGATAVLLWSLANPVTLDDGLRHVAMAKILAAEGIFTVPGWSRFLYHGMMSELPVDPWDLYDVMLMPLSALPPTIALKIVTLVEITLIATSSLLVLRSLRVSPQFQVWYLAVILLGDFHFTFRLFLGRPFPLFTALALLMLWMVLERQWAFMAIALAFAVLLSHLFIFPLFMAMLGCAWLLFCGQRKESLRAGIAIVIGITAGFLLHPTPMNYATYLFTAFVRIPFLRELSLGSELGRGLFTDSRSVLVALGILFLFLAIGMLRKGWRGFLRQKKVLLLLVPIVALAAAYALWMRAIDVLWPMLILGIAAVHAANPGIMNHIKSYFLPRRLPLVLLLWVLACGLTFQSGVAVHAIRGKNAKNSLSQFAALNRIPAGSRVLNVNWDNFPVFLTLRPDLKYATGMDPTFTHLSDKRASDLLHMLGEKSAKSNPLLLNAELWMQELLKRIPADYVVFARGRNAAVQKQLATSAFVAPFAATGALVIFNVQ